MTIRTLGDLGDGILLYLMVSPLYSQNIKEGEHTGTPTLLLVIMAIELVNNEFHTRFQGNRYSQIS